MGCDPIREREDVSELVDAVDEAVLRERVDRECERCGSVTGDRDALRRQVDVELELRVRLVRASRTRAYAASSSATGRRPFLVAFCWKMSANERATIARKPQSTSAHGACSREEPQPKLSPARRIFAPFASGARSGKSGRVRQSAKRRSREALLVGALEEARRNDLIGVDVVERRAGRRVESNVAKGFISGVSWRPRAASARR